MKIESLGLLCHSENSLNVGYTNFQDLRHPRVPRHVTTPRIRQQKNFPNTSLPKSFFPYVSLISNVRLRNSQRLPIFTSLLYFSISGLHVSRTPRSQDLSEGHTSNASRHKRSYHSPNFTDFLNSSNTHLLTTLGLLFRALSTYLSRHPAP